SFLGSGAGLEHAARIRKAAAVRHMGAPRKKGDRKVRKTRAGDSACPTTTGKRLQAGGVLVGQALSPAHFFKASRQPSSPVTLSLIPPLSSGKRVSVPAFSRLWHFLRERRISTMINWIAGEGVKLSLWMLLACVYARAAESPAEFFEMRV